MRNYSKENIAECVAALVAVRRFCDHVKSVEHRVDGSLISIGHAAEYHFDRIGDALDALDDDGQHDELEGSLRQWEREVQE